MENVHIRTESNAKLKIAFHSVISFSFEEAYICVCIIDEVQHIFRSSCINFLIVCNHHYVNGHCLGETKCADVDLVKQKHDHGVQSASFNVFSRSACAFSSSYLANDIYNSAMTKCKYVQLLITLPSMILSPKYN